MDAPLRHFVSCPCGGFTSYWNPDCDGTLDMACDSCGQPLRAVFHGGMAGVVPTTGRSDDEINADVQALWVAKEYEGKCPRPQLMRLIRAIQVSRTRPPWRWRWVPLRVKAWAYGQCLVGQAWTVRLVWRLAAYRASKGDHRRAH